MGGESGEGESGLWGVRVGCGEGESGLWGGEGGLWGGEG